MQHHRPILTQHRFQRYILWTLVLLSWIAAVLAGHHTNTRHLAQRGDISLAWLTRLVTNLLLIRAADMRPVSRSPGPHWRRNKRPRHFTRSLLGAELRRALKHKDLRQHVAQLINVLRNLDAYAAQLARNSYRRRRLWRITPPIAPAALLLGAPAPAPALADSS